jgi:3',5'-cyclic AMP phosphodiesterase CpdA
VIAFAQVSDIHIGLGEEAELRARRVFARLAALPVPVDAVLVTGDIADHGDRAEYVIARELFDSVPYPVFSCPGNHDDRSGYTEVLLGEDFDGGPINRVHIAGDTVFALCDSTVPGEPGGYLADDTLAWLSTVLEEAPRDAPVVVAFHHPPVDIHAPFLDGIRQTGEARLAEVLRGRENVVALLCGHAHTPAATTFAGLPLVIAPSVVSTVVLPWDGEGVVDFEPPPALAIHILDDARRLITHFRVVL